MSEVVSFFEYLEKYNTDSLIIRLFIAAVYGAILGMERGVKGRAAGLRTFTLVSLGAAAAMVTNQYLLASAGVSGDPSRMAAQVISGIGFLGVGTIVVSGKGHVTGLTTAAELWAVSIMGLSVGSGFVLGGTVCMLLIFFSTHLLKSVSRYQEEYNRKLYLYVEIGGAEQYFSFCRFIEDSGYAIMRIERKVQHTIIENDLPLYLEIDFGRRMEHRPFIQSLKELDGVHYMEEIC